MILWCHTSLYWSASLENVFDLMATYYKFCFRLRQPFWLWAGKGCRHNSVDSSVPSILPPGFKTQAHHQSFYQFELCHVEKTKINKKRPVLAHLIKTLTHSVRSTIHEDKSFCFSCLCIASKVGPISFCCLLILKCYTISLFESAH